MEIFTVDQEQLPARKEASRLVLDYYHRLSQTFAGSDEQKAILSDITNNDLLEGCHEEFEALIPELPQWIRSSLKSGVRRFRAKQDAKQIQNGIARDPTFGAF